MGSGRGIHWTFGLFGVFWRMAGDETEWQNESTLGALVSVLLIQCVSV